MRSLQSSPHFRYVNLSKIRNRRLRGQVFKTFGLNVGLNYFKPPEEVVKKADADTTVVVTSDATIVPTIKDSGTSVVTDGKAVLDESKSQLKEQSDMESDKKEQMDSEKQEKPKPKKKPTTGVVGSDDGSNVIVF